MGLACGRKSRFVLSAVAVAVAAVAFVTAAKRLDRANRLRAFREKVAEEEQSLDVSSRDADGKVRLLTELPSALPHDLRVIPVGMRLFQSRLLVGGSNTCGRCHALVDGGTDGRVRNGRRTPSLCCAGLWCRDLEAACGRMLRDACGISRASDEPPETRIRRDPVLRREMVRVFGDPFTSADIARALAGYVRTLLPPRGPFDRYLSGQTDALDAAQEGGLAVFRENGCLDCHAGATLGGRPSPLSCERRPAALRGLRYRPTFPEGILETMPRWKRLDDRERSDLRLFLKSL